MEEGFCITLSMMELTNVVHAQTYSTRSIHNEMTFKLVSHIDGILEHDQLECSV